MKFNVQFILPSTLIVMLFFYETIWLINRYIDALNLFIWNVFGISWSS